MRSRFARIAGAILCAAAVFTFAACGGDGDGGKEPDAPSVPPVTREPDSADTENRGVELPEVSFDSLTVDTDDSHIFGEGSDDVSRGGSDDVRSDPDKDDAPVSSGLPPEDGKGGDPGPSEDSGEAPGSDRAEADTRAESDQPAADTESDPDDALESLLDELLGEIGADGPVVLPPDPYD